jgi:hypothetical protein
MEKVRELEVQEQIEEHSLLTLLQLAILILYLLTI